MKRIMRLFTTLLALGLLAGCAVPAEAPAEESAASSDAVENLCEEGSRLFDHEYLGSEPVCIPETLERIAILDLPTLEVALMQGIEPVAKYAYGRDLIMRSNPDINVDVVQQLWNAYPSDALILDRENGRFADTGKLAPINHAGEFFNVAGPLTLPAHPSGSPPLFQAGASENGLNFAARNADAVFASAPQLEAARDLRLDLDRRVQALGRPLGSVRVLPGLTFVLADSRAEAERIDDEMDRDIPKRGANHWTIIGTPADAVESITEWTQAGAIDGFIALPGGWWGSLELFADKVVPALIERGIFQPGERALERMSVGAASV